MEVDLCDDRNLIDSLYNSYLQNISSDIIRVFILYLVMPVYSEHLQ